MRASILAFPGGIWKTNPPAAVVRDPYEVPAGLHAKDLVNLDRLHGLILCNFYYLRVNESARRVQGNKPDLVSTVLINAGI